MARALRILIAGGWYHVAARGNNRGDLFREDHDRQRFLSLLADVSARFHVEIHAFVLMDDHYHLVVRTRAANLSHAVRWLNVSHSLWFNARHRQAGHVFQGRFQSAILQDERRVAEVARYVHLNPVRARGLGAGKTRPRAGATADPVGKSDADWLAVLRDYPWSSWRAYAGAQPAPVWLDTRVLTCGCGGRTRKEQQEALRAYTEAPIRAGHLDRPWDRLIGGVVLGDPDFARRLFRGQGIDLNKHPAARQLAWRVPWDRIVRSLETERGTRWDAMLETYGDWGRDAAMYFAVRHGGHRLVEVVSEIPGLRYMAGAQAVKRFAAAMAKDPDRQRLVERLKRQLAEV